MLISLAGMTCLTCGVGHYGYGYTHGEISRVLPCDHCGADEVAEIEQAEFRRKIALRDPKHVQAWAEEFVKSLKK